MSNSTTESNLSTLTAELAESVRIARARLRLSQREVAELAGVGLQRVHEIENSKGDPKLSTVARITSAVGIAITVGGA